MLPLGFASFLGFGILLVLVGANQAELARDLDLDLSRSGLLSAALALGIGVGVVAAGPLFDRYPRRPLFLAAVLLVAGSLLSVDRSLGFGRTFLHVAIAGLGAGAYDTLLNAAVVERFHERAARPMLLLHSGATLGAVLGPFAIGGIGDWTASFHWTGVGHLLLAAWALCGRFPAPRSRPVPRSVFSRELLPFAAVAFAYVGVEAAVTIFAVPYAGGALGLDAERGRFAISAFWLGLLGGRLALLTRRGATGATLLVAAGVASGVLLAVGAVAGWGGIEPFFAAVGLALGGVYPVMIALAGARFPEARGTAAGLAAGAGALGGFAIPWLHGAIGDVAGAAAAVGGLAFWCLAVASAGAVARRRG